MESRQQEIYQEYLNKSGNITKSQKKHLKKVAKNKAKKEKRKNLQAAEQRAAELNGRLIEENHNGGPYSPEFTKKAEKYYIEKLLNSFKESPDQFLKLFRAERLNLQKLVLKWSDQEKRTSSFFFLVDLLDSYQEDRENGTVLIQYISDIISRKQKPTFFKKEYETSWKLIHG